MSFRCKEALVAVFGQPKVDSFPEPLLKLMEQFYDIAHKVGVAQGPPPGFDDRIYEEGRERGYYEAREELMHRMDQEVEHRLADERRWKQDQAKQMAPIKNSAYGPDHR